MSQLPPPPPPPGNGWAQPPGGYSAQNRNGLAIAGLVCGIGGFLCCIPAILAIVFGFISKNQIRQSGGTQGGDGMATAAIVLGCVWIGLSIILVAVGAVDVNVNNN